MKTIALIVGAGPGLSVSFPRAPAKRTHHIVIAARDTSDLRDLASEVGAIQTRLLERTWFAQASRAQTGQTPFACVHERRLAEAKRSSASAGSLSPRSLAAAASTATAP
ncbi:hypothetical protein [Roseobacter weihaiensis]|uniref:hypothetical protein n=1 Tax=Roseobacter weihaiensis TaxID=2763262 RepID=UPI001D0BA078|nr:hypothetical protein [Roseobacter sp. H9]